VARLSTVPIANVTAASTDDRRRQRDRRERSAAATNPSNAADAADAPGAADAGDAPDAADATTRLASEVESFGNGALVAWVRIPSLPATT